MATRRGERRIATGRCDRKRPRSVTSWAWRHPPVLVSLTLGSRVNGLAIVITTRTNGPPHASLVNTGVLDHPTTRELMSATRKGSAALLAAIGRRGRLNAVGT